MAQSDDQFWNIAAKEKAEEANLRLRLDGIESASEMVRRSLQLRSQPGFEDFVKSIEHMHKTVVRQLAQLRFDNDTLRELRGRAQGLNDVLAMLTRPDQSLELLASQKEDLQNALNEALKRRPKPREVPT